MNICIFGSSSENIDIEYLKSAEAFSSSASEQGFGIVFGAGKYGVMGACARGATSVGGELIGVSPLFFKEMEVLYDKCTEMIFTDTMRERKAIMEDKADAFVICAGGIGTFEEFFEVITLKQLSRHNKPIIIYNVKGYYNPLLAMMNHAVEQGFMSSDVNKLYSVADTEEQIFEQLRDYNAFLYNKYDDVKQGSED